MAATKASTATGTGAQEPGGQSVPATGQAGAGTNLPADPRQPAASQTPAAAAQEQTPPPAPPAEAEGSRISEAERLRRLEQSIVDRATARAHAEFARLQKQAAEAQRLAGMDDAELGAEVRRRQEMEAYASSVRAQDLAAIREQTLALVSDDTAREAVAEQERAGKFRTYGEFLQACVRAQLEVDGAKLRSRIEREVREAVQKELVADEADRGGPQLGSGNATPRLTLAAIKRMSTEEINERWEEVQAALSNVT